MRELSISNERVNGWKNQLRGLPMHYQAVFDDWHTAARNASPRALCLHLEALYAFLYSFVATKVITDTEQCKAIYGVTNDLQSFTTRHGPGPHGYAWVAKIADETKPQARELTIDDIS